MRTAYRLTGGQRQAAQSLIDWHKARNHRIWIKGIFRTTVIREGREITNDHLVMTDHRGYIKDYFWGKGSWKGQMGGKGRPIWRWHNPWRIYR
jgi:hypothetical protein